MPEARPVRWTPHAVSGLGAREIDRSEAERTLAEPDSVVPTLAGRRVHQRRYFDGALQQEMLLRAVVEESPSELVVVTAYRTSRFERCLGGPAE